MAKLVILGSSDAVPKEDQLNAQLLLLGDQYSLMVDCGWNPVARIRQLAKDPDMPDDLILTHFHPDHAAGLPSFLLSSWLLGRKNLLRIHGLNTTTNRAQKMMDLFGWVDWPDLYPVQFNPLEAREMVKVFENQDFRVFSSPTMHVIPSIGIRIEIPRSGKVLAYSSDTEPCPQMVRLAAGADILIHEATGSSVYHSSASQAGDIAQQAGAKSLYLIHYTGDKTQHPILIQQAQSSFGGPVHLASDLDQITL